MCSGGSFWKLWELGWCIGWKTIPNNAEFGCRSKGKICTVCMFHHHAKVSRQSIASGAEHLSHQ